MDTQVQKYQGSGRSSGPYYKQYDLCHSKTHSEHVKVRFLAHHVSTTPRHPFCSRPSRLFSSSFPLLTKFVILILISFQASCGELLQSSKLYALKKAGIFDFASRMLMCILPFPYLISGLFRRVDGRSFYLPLLNFFIGLYLLSFSIILSSSSTPWYLATAEEFLFRTTNIVLSYNYIPHIKEY